MTFRPNRAFIAQLEADPQVRRVLNDTAKRSGPVARQIAAGFARTGAYAESIEVDGNRLLTTDPAGSLIEFGSVNNPPFAPLRKAAEQVGAKVVDDG